MDKYENMTRKEACYFLGVRENASDEQIKRAYRYKAKLYHPDANPTEDTREYYIKAQKAYEYLISHPYVTKDSENAPAGNTASASYRQPVPGGAYFYQTPLQRPAKIFATSAATRESYKKQKEMASEREKIEKWDKDYKDTKRRKRQMQMYGKEYMDEADLGQKSEEEKILDKIRAIWIAENIKRQIQQDKEQKEMLNRRKLYQAFMQQKLQDDNK
ncbi:MAG: DnaJ domain-containing protein [Lachnospiraceae bacterium]|nr:DnaJ domain-containing protein [Lachnospiraceae bacterium]